MSKVDKIQAQLIEIVKYKNTGIVNWFCGFGKTKSEFEVMDLFHTSVLLTPRNILIDQHLSKYNKNRNVEIYNCENKPEQKNEKQKKIYLVNNSSWFRFIEYCYEINKKIDCIVVDEAHTNMKKIIDCSVFNSIQNRYLFTATPDECILNKYKVLSEISYKDCLNFDRTTPFKLDLILENIKTQEKYIEKLTNKMNLYSLKKCIGYFKGVEIDKPLYFTVKDFEKFHKKVYNGFKILIIYSQNKNNVLQEFETEEKCIILSCDTISYGIDINSADCVLLDEPGFSHNKIIQQMSRCLRKKDDKKLSYVFLKFSDLDIDKDFLQIENEKDNGKIIESKNSKILAITAVLQEGLKLDLLNDFLKKNIQIKNSEEDVDNKEESFISDDTVQEIINEKLENGEVIPETLKKARNCMKDINEEQKSQPNTVKKYNFSDFFTENNISVKFENNKGLLKVIVNGDDACIPLHVLNWVKNNSGKEPKKSNKNKEEHKVYTYVVAVLKSNNELKKQKLKEFFPELCKKLEMRNLNKIINKDACIPLHVLDWVKNNSGKEPKSGIKRAEEHRIYAYVIAVLKTNKELKKQKLREFFPELCKKLERHNINKSSNL